ncbi:hypothetical protein M2150_002619 [Lachnospiraceae bacterium PM6-15]|uniref:phage tail tip lysozyme n=1 Tax=Ohessyouella blattaphilus TaxID=2949333 RepID=UPI003E2E2669
MKLFEEEKFNSKAAQKSLFIRRGYQPQKYLKKKERRQWNRLSARKKQQYLEKATENYLRKNQKPSSKSLPTCEEVTNQTIRVNEITASPRHDDVSHVEATIARSATKLAAMDSIKKERQVELGREEVIEKMMADDFKKAASATGGVGEGIAMVAGPKARLAMVAVVPVFLAVLVVVMLSASLLLMVIASARQSDGGKRLVEVALAEEKEGNQKGGDKYWSWFGFKKREEWCACFVSWCADQCDYIEKEIFPKSASVAQYRSWYDKRNLYMKKEGYTPKVGDLIIFENGMSHIGIVQYVKGNQVITIEGNTGDIVATRTYPLSYSGISGYCVPNYPEEFSDFEGETNEEITWNFLINKGFSPESAAGIMGNLKQESGIDPKCYQQGGGPGRGIAQWTVGSNRFQNLESRATSMGTTWDTIEPQLEHLYFELNGGEATTVFILNRDYGGLAGFKAMTDVNKATLAFEKAFERAGIPAMEKRYKYAMEFYQKYKGGGPMGKLLFPYVVYEVQTYDMDIGVAENPRYRLIAGFLEKRNADRFMRQVVNKDKIQVKLMDYSGKKAGEEEC